MGYRAFLGIFGHFKEGYDEGPFRLPKIVSYRIWLWVWVWIGFIYHLKEDHPGIKRRPL
jgi:hypothetical protein